MSKQSSIWLLALLTLVLIAPTGCKVGANEVVTKEKSVSDTTLPSGWKRVETVGDKISIGCPPGWNGMDLTGADINSIKDNSGEDKDTKALIEQAALNKQIKLIALHPAEKSGFRPNVNVLKIDGAGDATLDQALQANVDQLKGDALGTPASSKVTVDGNDAYLVKWKKSSVMGDLDIQSYLFLKDGSEVIVTFTDTAGSPTIKQFDDMIKTFHVG